MRQVDPVARRQSELRLRVGEHLDAGEMLHAALWVARESGLSTIARITRWEGALEGRLGFGGAGPTASPPRALEGTAAEMDRHLPDPAAPAALALTDAHLLLFAADAEPPDARPPDARLPDARLPDARLPDARPPGLRDRLRLAGRRMLGRAEPPPLPRLELLWQCPRTALASVGVSDPEGALALGFVDGSSLSVVAPAMLAVPFAEAARRSRDDRKGGIDERYDLP
ncbi:hypothetical protein FHR83_002707 [Actinoplanes campanulatus]|uniref:Uncharacterized protein n=1 Tax=Actinoplanes campanulatus TaxID=113559 RepID=A0A7W5AFI2_9ACTN|nr:hypothetical protein [Actinoplanes campanulatus]MBB3095044.1 hypothetical protein [Actinoplanes campanulatus]GGN23071.1 hypothetical protein GCM10010109_37880 [Actinoplanes campanulatus]GID34647.1 hypothetical protein Aca09nite_11530 [Actinoplanes campanulatus]